MCAIAERSQSPPCFPQHCPVIWQQRLAACTTALLLSGGSSLVSKVQLWIWGCGSSPNLPKIRKLPLTRLHAQSRNTVPDRLEGSVQACSTVGHSKTLKRSPKNAQGCGCGEESILGARRHERSHQGCHRAAGCRDQGHHLVPVLHSQRLRAVRYLPRVWCERRLCSCKAFREPQHALCRLAHLARSLRPHVKQVLQCTPHSAAGICWQLPQNHWCTSMKHYSSRGCLGTATSLCHAACARPRPSLRTRPAHHVRAAADGHHTAGLSGQLLAAFHGLQDCRTGIYSPACPSCSRRSHDL